MPVQSSMLSPIGRYVKYVDFEETLNLVDSKHADTNLL
jgi:hypothetical protein